VPGKATPGAVWRGAHRCGRSAAAGSVRAFNGRGHCRVGWRGPMRCPAPPNACTEAAAVTDSCGWSGAWRAGEEAGEVAQGNRQALPRGHRRLWSVRRRRSAASARSSTRQVRLSARPIAASERSSLEGLGVAEWAMLGRPVRWLRELGVLPRRPVRPPALPALGSVPHVPAPPRSLRSAGFRARTRSSTERRRGHGRCGHTFSGAEGAERSARTRFGSSRSRTVVQRGRGRHRAAGEVAHCGFTVPK
jgi:hypothetical protein